ncbi:class I SAM-dependent methyltransferase [Bosea sp. (in: a-proteobacteria)]|uniref:class I SAM-dependent methyltransferase n=1 Tax=Bosea sp. (in: a-proteobacteria) TaxID=1871050 RepID=UPI0025C22D9F|nr:class I SAM-dependent methyltransferase [Bosea sp. (in: a-proteobacteria)]MBR3191989.1 class I SAM-dependent methyltransferase [Bosea sp. (in: a-proteobacteria)]
MQTETVALTREKETLLITLWAKAGESLLPDSLLKDRFAAQAATRLDYDFARLKVDRDLMVGLAMRAHTLDGWTRAFLAEHSDAIVLHLGCGLDSRVFRIDPPAGVAWYDIDYPDVIALRQKLYPARDGYHLLGSSVTEPGWIAAVPRDRPAMIVAEGLLPYLPEEEVPLLLERLVQHCPSGEIVFDAYSPLGLKLIAMQPSIKATGAVLHWSLADPVELELQVPGLELVTELTAYDPDGYDRRQIARMSWPARLAMQFFSLIPPLSRIGVLLRYRF